MSFVETSFLKSTKFLEDILTFLNFSKLFHIIHDGPQGWKHDKFKSKKQIFTDLQFFLQEALTLINAAFFGLNWLKLVVVVN